MTRISNLVMPAEAGIQDMLVTSFWAVT